METKRVLFVSKRRLNSIIVKSVKEIHGFDLIVDSDSVCLLYGVAEVLRVFRKERYVDIIVDLPAKEVAYMARQGVFPLVPKTEIVFRNQAEYFDSEGKPRRVIGLQRLVKVTESGDLIF